jgi:hypothetical protein
MTEDVSYHAYLALRVRAAGHPRTRGSYYVNIQTDGPITTDLWQHRLFFRRDDGGWEDLFVRRSSPRVRGLCSRAPLGRSRSTRSCSRTRASSSTRR